MKKETEKLPSYSELRELREKKREYNGESIFCFITGTLITVFSLSRALYMTGIPEKIFYVLTFAGLVIILSGAFCPAAAGGVMKVFRKFVNFIGKYIIMIFLLPVYLIVFILSLFLKKRVGKNYEFYSWEETPPDYEPHYIRPENREYKHKKFSFFSVLYNICTLFIEKKQIFLIPVAVILIILGIVFFFISTSTVFSFVYTLF